MLVPDYFTIDALIALVTLAGLEIVLGIDNIVFIAIITGRLDPAVQPRARRVGLLAAMGMRIALLFCITWIMQLEDELFTILGHGFSGKDLILLAGGLFLLGKATLEIHHKLEAPGQAEKEVTQKIGSFGAAIAQIAIIDMVFSIDSVITAVGIAEHIQVMIAAIVIAVGVMMVFAEPVSHFVERHPTMKMLALAFLLLIGVTLMAEGLHHHIPRGYVYSAMAFSLFVEILNLRVRRRREQVRLNSPTMPRAKPEQPA